MKRENKIESTVNDLDKVVLYSDCLISYYHNLANELFRLIMKYKIKPC